jgi:hypothetical protein
MKRAAILLFVCLITGTMAFGQVAISTDNSAPDNSAMLDVKSISKGILAPRMTFAQRDAIASPATGLLVFCTDNNFLYTNQGTPASPLWIMVNTQWSNAGLNIYYNGGNVGIGTTSPAVKLQVSGKIAAEFGTSTSASYIFGSGLENTGFSSPQANVVSVITDGLERVRFAGNGAVGVGTSSPGSSAIVDIVSTSKGLLPPRMTYEQRNAIVSPAEGLMVFCTNCNSDGSGVLSFYENGFWQSVSLTCIKPVTPPEGVHVQSNTQIIWNWNAVPIADGYKWHTSNNFAAATDMGTATTKTETGLTQGTSYTRYVWAYNACGNTEPVVLQGQALSCGSSFTKAHTAGTVAPVNKTVTYGTVTNIPGETSKCWITRNLGASQQPVSVNDATEAPAGWYWQFNTMQGYKHDGTTRTPNTTWIGPINENSGWVANNDPCSLLLGSAWRIPTSTEWTNVDAAGNWTNWNGPFSSGLQMHAAGYLSSSNGSLSSRGSYGDYWSSTQYSASTGWGLYFYSGSIAMGDYYKVSGFSARCLRDN